MSILNFSDFVAGCFAGACGTLIGHPFDTIKTWQQANNSKVGHAMFEIITRNNGMNGFYRGMLFPLFTTGALNSIMFGIYGNQLRSLQIRCQGDETEKRQLWNQHVFIAGSISGFVHSFFACPLELIKIQLQMQNSKEIAYQFSKSKLSVIYYHILKYVDQIRGRNHGPFAITQMIYKQNGVLGFYRGLLPTMCRDVFPYGVYMFTYDKLSSHLSMLSYLEPFEEHIIDDVSDYTTNETTATDPNASEHEPTDRSHYSTITKKPYHFHTSFTIISGAVASVVSCMIVMPFDVVKTIYQAETSPDTYRNILHCVSVNVQKSGYKIFFRGSLTYMARSIPVNVATFHGYEIILALFGRRIQS